jgi:hypothetical protein
VPLHPCVPGSPTAVSQGPGTQVRHAAPLWRGASVIDHHDRIFPRERHHITSARVFIVFHTTGEGPRDHEILYHVVVLKLVLDGVHVVRAGLLEESLKVVCRRSCLVLATMCGSCDVPHTEGVTHRGCCLRLFLPPLEPFLASWTAMSDGASLSLLGVASLLPEVGKSLVTSLPVAYWAAMLRRSSVVYLKMSFGAYKGSGCCALRTQPPGAFTPAP